MIAVDSETGEFFLASEETPVAPQVDLETGEHEAGGPQRRSFRIPIERPPARLHKRRRRRLKADPQEAELIAAAIFLLPTMVLFRPWLAVAALLLELLLHRWSHDENRRLGGGGAVYFRSPLHAIAKEFCGRCKDQSAADKISRLQDIKNDKLKNYIRRIVN